MSYPITDLAYPPKSIHIEPSYIIWTDGSMIYAKNGNTGKIDFSGTNASTVIQNAIDALTSGGTIHIKKGNYAIPTQLLINSASNLSITMENGTRLYRSGSMSYHLLKIYNSTNITIEGGCIDGVNDDTTEGTDEYESNSIRIDTCTDIKINKVKLDNPSDDGIYIYKSNKVSVTDCHVLDFYKHAIDIVSTDLSDTSNNVVIQGNFIDADNGQIYDGITVYAYSPKGISIVNNVCMNVYNSGLGTDQSGIHVEDQSGTPDNDSITIVGNTVTSCKYGITSATSRPVSITGNAISDCITRGIFLFAPTYITVQGNIIKNTPYGIYLHAGSETVIQGNVIVDSSSYGIYVYGTAGNSLTKSAIINNSISDSDTGIYISCGEKVNIIGNILYKIEKHGIELTYTKHTNISNNIILDVSQNNNNTYDSINITADVTIQSYWNTIIGNCCTALGAKLARYHLYMSQYVGTTSVAHNRFDNAGTAKVYFVETTNTFFNNTGYVSENTGTATISAGNTYVDVTHGLGFPPTHTKIKLIPLDNLGGRSLWITDVGSTTFRINMSSTDTSDHSIGWSY